MPLLYCLSSYHPQQKNKMAKHRLWKDFFD